MTIDDQYWHSGSDKPKGCWFESNRGSLTRSFTLSRHSYPRYPVFSSIEKARTLLGFPRGTQRRE
jgi:hypothetical protein